MRLFLSLLSLCCLFTLSACNNYGTKLKLGSIEVYYTKDVTATEANKLCQYLDVLGFNDNNTRKTVQLAKSGNTYEVRMVVKKGLDQDPEYQALLKTFATKLSQNVFNGETVEVHACDDRLKTLRVFLMRH